MLVVGCLSILAIAAPASAHFDVIKEYELLNPETPLRPATIVEEFDGDGHFAVQLVRIGFPFSLFGIPIACCTTKVTVTSAAGGVAQCVVPPEGGGKCGGYLRPGHMTLRMEAVDGPQFARLTVVWGSG